MMNLKKVFFKFGLHIYTENLLTLPQLLSKHYSKGTPIYALTLISYRNRHAKSLVSLAKRFCPHSRMEDEKICYQDFVHSRPTVGMEGRKEIDIVICSCKNCLALGVCTYYHTITTRQLMIYDATTERSARK